MNFAASEFSLLIQNELINSLFEMTDYNPVPRVATVWWSASTCCCTGSFWVSLKWNQYRIVQCNKAKIISELPKCFPKNIWLKNVNNLPKGGAEYHLFHDPNPSLKQRSWENTSNQEAIVGQPVRKHLRQIHNWKNRGKEILNLISKSIRAQAKYKYCHEMFRTFVSSKMVLGDKISKL